MSSTLPPVETRDPIDNKWSKQNAFIREVMEDADLDRKNEQISSHLQSNLGNFADSVSAHGIGKIYGSKSCGRRLVWILICIFMVSFGAYQCYQVITEFLQYPKKVAISIKEDTVVEFPAVTVCNLNPLASKDLLEDHPLWGAFIAVEDANVEPICDGLKSVMDEDNFEDYSDYYNYFDGEEGLDDGDYDAVGDWDPEEAWQPNWDDDANILWDYDGTDSSTSDSTFDGETGSYLTSDGTTGSYLTSDGTTESYSTSDGTTESYSTSDGTTGSYSTSDGTTGSGSTTGGTSGSELTVSSTTGSDSTSGETTVSGFTTTGTTGSTLTTGGTTESDSTTAGTTGSDSTTAGTTGSDSSTGSDSTTAGTTGSDSTTAGTTGSDSTTAGTTGSDSTTAGTTGSDSTTAGTTGSDSTTGGTTESELPSIALHKIKLVVVELDENEWTAVGLNGSQRITVGLNESELTAFEINGTYWTSVGQDKTQWVNVGLNGTHQMAVAINGSEWVTFVIKGTQWTTVGLNKTQSTTFVLNGNQRTTIGLNGNPSTTFEINGIQWTAIDQNETQRVTVELNGTQLVTIGSNGIKWTTFEITGTLSTSVGLNETQWTPFTINGSQQTAVGLDGNELTFHINGTQGTTFGVNEIQWTTAGLNEIQWTKVGLIGIQLTTDGLNRIEGNVDEDGLRKKREIPFKNSESLLRHLSPTEKMFRERTQRSQRKVARTKVLDESTEEENWVFPNAESTLPKQTSPQRDQIMDFKTFSKRNWRHFVGPRHSSWHSRDKRSAQAENEMPDKPRLTLADIKKIRLRCSVYYKYLDYMSKQDGVTSGDTLSFKANKAEDCPVDNYKEQVSYNPLCRLEIFCDNYGCFDYHLKEYREKVKYDKELKAHLRCPSCSPTGECWPQEFFKSWESGELSAEQVYRMFESSRTPDFSDIMGLYSPTAKDLKNYSIPAYEFILTCSFDRRPCSYRQFHTWTSDKYGMCYTFNTALRKVVLKNNKTVYAKPRKSSSIGPRNGVRLTIGIKASKYLSLLSPDVGARVVVHSPSQLPFPEDEGFDISPGLSVSVAIKRKKLERVGPPHGNCQDESESEVFKEYSAIRCKKLCLEKEYWNACKCFVGQSPVYDLGSSTKPSIQCSPFNVTQKICMETVIFSYQQRLLNCDCPPACNEIEYNTQVTSTEENRRFYTVVQNIRKVAAGSDLCSGVENETVRLHLYLDSLSFETIHESPAYTWDTLVCNVGGNLGLFIGMSLVTMVEFMEFLFDVIFFWCHLPRKNKQSTRNEVHPANKKQQDPEVPLPVKVRTKKVSTRPEAEEAFNQIFMSP